MTHRFEKRESLQSISHLVQEQHNMVRATLFAALLAVAFSVNATPPGPGTFRAGFNGALSIDHTTQAGSGVATGSDVSGSLYMNSPGFTRVNAWSHNDTRVSSKTVIERCGGKCSTVTLKSSANGVSNSRGGASGFIGPRIDPVRASFSAGGEGVAYSDYTRSFTLDLSGFARYKQVGLDN